MPVLVARIDGASNLISQKKGESADPYVYVVLNGKELATGKRLDNTLNPRWNLDYTFDVPKEGELIVNIYAHRRIHHDELLGLVKINLGSLQYGKILNGPWPLENGSGELHMTLSPYAGFPNPKGIEGPVLGTPLGFCFKETSGVTLEGINYEYLYQGFNAVIRLDMPHDCRIKSEPGAMVAMTPTIQLDASMEGGLLKGFGRAIAGESFFISTFHAVNGPGQLYLTQALPGDLSTIHTDGSVDWTIQKGGYLASTPGIIIESKSQGIAKGLFSGEGFFLLHAKGAGTIFISSFGSIQPLTLQPGEQMVVDNGHMVAWPTSMQYTIEKAAKGWFSSITSGEGIVCRFTGPGTVYIQSKNPSAFGHWCTPYLRR